MKKLTILFCLLLALTSTNAQRYEFLKHDKISGGRQMPPDAFRRVLGKHFSYLTVGNNTSTPLVSNVSLDLADAKFELNGGLPLCKKSNAVILGLSLKGDKDGNVATLFNRIKAGSNFEGEVKFHFLIKPKFYYQGNDAADLISKVRAAEFLGNAEYVNAKRNYVDNTFVSNTSIYTLRRTSFERLGGWEKMTQYADTVRLNPQNTGIVKLHTTMDSLWGLMETSFTAQNPDYVADTLSRITKKVIAQKTKLYDNAVWSSSHVLWFTLKAGVGGEKFYTIGRKDSLSYYNDTVKKENFVKYSVAGEFNYYYTNYKWITFYGNAGLGCSYSSNLAQLSDKYVVSYNAKGVDTVSGKSFSEDKSTSIKYDAYLGKAEAKLYLINYFNAYFLFTESQMFGLHVFNEFKYHNADNRVNSTGVGLIANVSSKKEAKNILGVEAYFKIRTDKQSKVDFKNEQTTEVGLQFNVPIVAFNRIK